MSQDKLGTKPEDTHMKDPEKNVTSDKNPASFNKDGSYKRAVSEFRNFITADGSSGFPAVAGRYTIVVANACPWCHRVLAMIRLKGLQDAFDFVNVDWLMTPKGWSFNKDEPFPGESWEYIRDLYFSINPDYANRFTVPVVWDKEQKTIVSNESSEIIRFLNTEFSAISTKPDAPDFYPAELQSLIDEINDPIYNNINNGVYKSGFAKTQQAYDTAVKDLFSELDNVEERLSKNRYLAGKQLTEADVRLFVTLVRFDPVYNFHFKCSLRRIRDYPNINGYMRELYQMPEFKDSTDFNHIINHYYQSHEGINPNRIVPHIEDPEINLLAPHGRDAL